MTAMKQHRHILLLWVALLGATLSATAQELVFSGKVVGLSPKTGSLILAGKSKTTITLTGLQHARIRAADGRVVSLDGLRPGMNVSVAYLPQGKRVSRVLVASEAEPDVIPVITDRRYRSLFDGDITTNPGSKAAVDGDITTKPGSKAAADSDITTKPPGNANTDGDITTKADR
jgi:hypothetical protein